MEYYIQAFRQFADFEGRWTRTQYWMFVLINFLIALAVAVVANLIGMEFLSSIYSLVLLIPGISAGVRRLHDSGRSGWWMLLCLIPVIGWIALIVLLAMPTQSAPAAAEA
ncbi:DUF805 domain-containing protein [Gilvimarinus xylanilyticus]|uniref:DUF805 domain-containing protein n=1 Tax=Gilvimarinus xylanilyticus TaxID=2944139 RepID=A0A9X2I4E0_9GAMM|nr:DUF805 domain-containing protein [Gilvimarinus xylanilyticus]MCP8899811.1 DUF805 domain-containing protein [Gilvimarinus xylanilyticus]